MHGGWSDHIDVVARALSPKLASCLPPDICDHDLWIAMPLQVFFFFHHQYPVACLPAISRLNKK